MNVDPIVHFVRVDVKRVLAYRVSRGAYR